MRCRPKFYRFDHRPGYLRKVVPADRLEEVLVAYNDALLKTFGVALVLACLRRLVLALP